MDTIGGHRCSCDPGYELRSNNKDCEGRGSKQYCKEQGIEKNAVGITIFVRNAHTLIWLEHSYGLEDLNSKLMLAFFYRGTNDSFAAAYVSEYSTVITTKRRLLTNVQSRATIEWDFSREM